MYKPKVIFDRSIFHGEKFNLLKNSNLLDYVKSDKIQLFYTPIFIEETLQRFKTNKSEAIEHFNYVLKLNSELWFNYTENIIELELQNSDLDEKYFLQPPNYSNVFKCAIDHYGFLVDFKKILNQSNENRSYNLKFREAVLAFKKESSSNKLKKIQSANFDVFVEDLAEHYITKGIIPYYNNSNNFLDTWKNNRSRCIFTYQYLKTLFSAVFIPATNHQAKIHLNDKVDAEQLAYLIWADVFVSDDSKFMKDAFNLVYGESEKKFMSSQEFLDFILNL